MADEAGPLRARRLVDDDDSFDAIDAVDAEERAPHVGREGTDPAGTRWVGRDDRGAQPRPFVRGSAAAPRRQHSRFPASVADIVPVLAACCPSPRHRRLPLVRGSSRTSSSVVWSKSLYQEPTGQERVRVADADDLIDLVGELPAGLLGGHRDGHDEP